MVRLEQLGLKFHHARAANARQRREGSAERVLERARDEVSRRMRADRPVAHRMLDAGTAFGAPIQVGVWLIGPTVDADRQILADLASADART